MRTLLLSCALTIFAIALAVSPSERAHAAQKPASNAAPQTAYVLPEAETWDVISKDGAKYQILVSRPDPKIKPPPEDGYPVLYVLDGNAFFAMFADARRVQGVYDNNEITKSIIVAVGYPTSNNYGYDYARRMEDFTAPWPDPLPASEKRFGSWKAGGQDRFLTFLLEQLRPEVAKRYPIDPNRQALFGHSLGGLFALHVLYTHPNSFAAIIAASPSIFWHDSQILGEERAFAESLAQGRIRQPIAKLLMVAGEREDTPVELWDAQAAAPRLAALSAYGLRSHFEMFKDETHITVPSRAVTSALRFALVYP